MGGGSSSDQKTNEINRQVFENLQKEKQRNGDNNNHQKKNLKKKSPKNSPKNSPRNSPRTKQPEKFQLPMQQPIQNIRGKGQQDFVNQKDLRNSKTIDKQCLGTIFLSKIGIQNIGISIITLKPNKQSSNFDFLNQQNDIFQSLLKWNFDPKQKNWNFSLQQPQSNGLSFTVSINNELIKGDAEIWQLFNPCRTGENKSQTEDHFEEIQFNYVAEDDQSSYFWPSMQELKQNKTNLCRQWGQQPVQVFAHFHHNKTKKQDILNQPKFPECIETRKYFSKSTLEWNLSIMILQMNHSFITWIVKKIQAGNSAIDNLVEKQTKIVDIKRQIYVQKMKISKRKNQI